jgi:hypothetical protein
MAHPLVVNVKTAGCDVYVGRPTKWGNPFKTGSHQSRVDSHREWIKTQPDLIAAAKRELRGKALGCHCSPRSCHADVLAEIANA